MSEITTWFNGLPTFTRYWFGLSVAFPLAGRIGLLSAHHLILSKDFLNHFQLWRPITALFFYPLSPQTGFHYLMNLYFLYSYSVRLEKDTFNGRPADYLFMLIFNWVAIVLIGLFMNIYLLMDPAVLSVLYIWCQLNKDVIVNFWFGTKFKAMYLPWVLLLFNMVLSGGGTAELVGIIVGHLYYFVMFKYPVDYGGASLIQTPRILYDYFPSVPGRGGFHAEPPQQRRDGGASGVRGRHQWGSGNTLGS